jgi:hypothetical protein
MSRMAQAHYPNGLANFGADLQIQRKPSWRPYELEGCAQTAVERQLPLEKDQKDQCGHWTAICGVEGLWP